MEDNKKDVFISIKSVHGYDLEETEEMDFITDGEYIFGEDGCVLSYNESEVTGMPGTRTVMSVSSDGIVVDRSGEIWSRMNFKEGLRDAFLYSTPYGTAKLGIDTRKISKELSPAGGKIEIDYVVNMEHLIAMRNKFIVDIKEQGTKQ